MAATASDLLPAALEAALGEARSARLADPGAARTFLELHNRLHRQWQALRQEPDYMFAAHKRMAGSLGWTVFTYVCFVGSVACGLAALIPQIVRTFRTRDTEALSLVFVVLLLSTFLIRGVNAAMHREVANIVLLALLAIQYLLLLGLKVQYSYVDPLPGEDASHRW